MGATAGATEEARQSTVGARATAGASTLHGVRGALPAAQPVASDAQAAALPPEFEWRGVERPMGCGACACVARSPVAVGWAAERASEAPPRLHPTRIAPLHESGCVAPDDARAKWGLERVGAGDGTDRRGCGSAAKRRAPGGGLRPRARTKKPPLGGSPDVSQQQEWTHGPPSAGWALRESRFFGRVGGGVRLLHRGLLVPAAADAAVRVTSGGWPHDVAPPGCCWSVSGAAPTPPNPLRRQAEASC